MDNNTIKVYTTSSGTELSLSTPSTKQLVSATNNRAQYYSELSKKYRDEAKLHRDNAQYYAEQNSNVTLEYITNVRAVLEESIAAKQPLGDYALKAEIPEMVSELENDAEYVTQSNLAAVIEEIRLPSQEGCEDTFLHSDGENLSWQKVKLRGFTLFDTKFSDHVLAGDEAIGWAIQGSYVSKAVYPDFYNKCLEEKNAGVVTQTTLGNSTMTTYNHANGHIYYDIADISVADAFFNTNGICWMYGIDTENERIFLPRQTLYDMQNSIPVSIFGTGMSLGLTNGTGNGALLGNSNGSWVWSNQYGTKVGTSLSGSGNLNGAGKTFGITTDSTKSGITGRVDLTNYTAKNNYLYICVGNTVVNQADVDVANLTVEVQNLDNKINNFSFNFNWVPCYKVLSTATALGSYTLDLSTILPNDGYMYEIILQYRGYHTSDSYTQGQTYITSEYFSAIAAAGDGKFAYMVNGGDKYQEEVTATGIIPIGAQRSINLHHGAVAHKDFILAIYAYRKLSKY